MHYQIKLKYILRSIGATVSHQSLAFIGSLENEIQKQLGGLRYE